jgi:hypothetical protein
MIASESAIEIEACQSPRLLAVVPIVRTRSLASRRPESPRVELMVATDSSCITVGVTLPGRHLQFIIQGEPDLQAPHAIAGVLWRVAARLRIAVSTTSGWESIGTWLLSTA